MTKRTSSLDGLRAIAIILVVASHVGILSQGGFGNGVFFCLSGFLAAVPFKQNVENSFLSIKRFGDYYLGRLIRILPIYYIMIIGYYYLTRRFFDNRRMLLRNMLFIEGTSHFWFLQQQMVLYACVPVIFVIVVLLKKLVKGKHNDLFCAVILLLGAFAAQKWFTNSVFYLYGNGGYQQLRLGQFLIGFSLGYLNKWFIKLDVQLEKNKWVSVLGQCVTVLFIAFAVVSAEPILKLINPIYEGYFIGWRLPMVCSLATALAIIGLLVAPNGLVSKILGWKPIAYIGEVSFGIYIVHMFLIPYCSFGSVYRNFLAAFGVSFCISAVLHVLVEKPSGILAKTKSVRSVIEYFQKL